ncbi:RluA family pseudouridine synthase [Clostridium bornimense]|uniref:RluA family pseudouridine synthase n=1 Tax=Clostridium bornimense TaxID=1216932 RepID=UPI001C106599|nr:RluA family pseudouridine synthase [Clostridium bornimense]MBU5314722.1 RluA family pseudouridine synthase [Clostridium bornimense]
MKEERVVVSEQYNNSRLDKFLTTIFSDKSRSFFQNIIEEDLVKVNDSVRKSNYKLKENDIVEVKFPDAVEGTIKPENIPIEILYEDDDIIIVNKVQGMIVHPAPGVYSGTLVNALLYHCKDLSGINGVVRPGIVHRIDKDTSGILVIAKNDFAHMKLSEDFKKHSITREYVAITEGVIKSDSGTIDKPLARDPKERIKIAIVEGGRRAVTHYSVEKRFKSNTMVRCTLETGRTHQIRVHMASIGHPLVGDPVYGYKKQKFKVNGQMLHAAKLGFIHPTKGTYMEFTSDVPKEFQKVLQALGNT